ncbi:MAG TPA: hypothetical protein VI076_05250 [Actinopolymorphaceae bacterium]
MMHSRRDLLRRTGLVGLLAGVGGIALPNRRAHAEALDYTARETYDLFDRVFHDSGVVGQPTDTNEHGGLAWGQSYVLASFLRMYQAYQDDHYLDRLVHNADLVLANRDNERGVTDYTGRSLPAWRAMHPYTVGVATLADSAGRPLLEVRSALAYADETPVTVTSGSSEQTFGLEIVSTKYGYRDELVDLSLDPASDRYAVDVIYQAYPTSLKVTARDVRSDRSNADVPVHGTVSFSSQPVIFAVHTGMITYPLASFVRTVYRTPRLRSDARYKAKADAYLEAVRGAIEACDAEWREDGYFQWPKGMPVPYDGTEQPVNQSLTLGLTYAEIAAATGDTQLRARATKLARMLAGQLVRTDGDAYVWRYWPTFGHMYNGFTKTGDVATDISEYTPEYGSPGKGAQQYEDLSHGAIEVEFAALAFRHGLHFRGLDMVRFARTYTQNLATTDENGTATTVVRVDGSGGLAPSGQYLQAPRWMAVAPWDEQLFGHAHRIYVDHDVQPGFGSGLACVAYLNWFARRD